MPDWNWGKLPLKAVADVYDGPHATPDKTDSGPWYLNIGSLQSGRLMLAESAHLSEEDFLRWTRRVRPVEGDVLFSYETRLGEAAMMPAGLRACLGRRMGLLRPRRDRLDPRFLLYAYLGPEFQGTISQRMVHGATVERIPISEVGDWEVAVPPLPEQRAIAEVLGALDDKIEANRNVIETAWALAEADFERVTASSETRELGNLLQLAYGKGLPAESRAAGNIPVWGSGGVVGFHNEALVNGPGIVVGRKGSVGTVYWCKEDFFPIDTTFYVTKPHIPLIFAYFTLRSLGLGHMNSDSAVPGLNRSAAYARLVRVPAAGELEAFCRTAEPLAELVGAAEQETAWLAGLRDALLPKLLSGELRVRDAESLVGEAV